MPLGKVSTDRRAALQKVALVEGKLLAHWQVCECHTLLAAMIAQKDIKYTARLTGCP